MSQHIVTKSVTSLPRLLAHKSTLTLADQGVTSAANFLTGVIIGRTVPRELFGVYILGYSILMFIMNIQTALIFSPYMVYSPRLKGDKLDRYTGSCLIHQLILSGLAIIFLGLAWVSLSQGIGPKGLMDIIGTLAGGSTFILMREYVRQTCFSQMRAGMAFVIDSCIAILQVGGILAVASFGMLSVKGAYLIIGFACGVPVTCWLLATRRRLKFSAREIRSDFQRNWSFSKWLFAGSFAYFAGSQLYPWFLASSHDVALAGVLAACTSVVNFANPFLIGMGNFLGPSTAHAFDKGGAQELGSYVIRMTILLTVAIGLLCTVFLFAGGWVVSHVYGSRYAGNGVLVGLLALSQFSSAITYPANYGLFALERTDVTFKCDLLSLICAFSAGFWLVRIFGLLGVGYGLLLSHIITSTFRFLVFHRALSAVKRTEKRKNLLLQADTSTTG